MAGYSIDGLQMEPTFTLTQRDVHFMRGFFSELGIIAGKVTASGAGAAALSGLIDGRKVEDASSVQFATGGRDYYEGVRVARLLKGIAQSGIKYTTPDGRVSYEFIGPAFGLSLLGAHRPIDGLSLSGVTADVWAAIRGGVPPWLEGMGVGAVAGAIGRIVSTNPAFGAILGLGAAEVQAMASGQWFPSLTDAAVAAAGGAGVDVGLNALLGGGTAPPAPPSGATVPPAPAPSAGTGGASIPSAPGWGTASQTPASTATGPAPTGAAVPPAPGTPPSGDASVPPAGAPQSGDGSDSWWDSAIGAIKTYGTDVVDGVESAIQAIGSWGG